MNRIRSRHLEGIYQARLGADLMRSRALRWWRSGLALAVVVALVGAGAALAHGRGPTLDSGGYGYLVRPTSIYYTGDGSGVVGVLRSTSAGESGPGRGSLRWERWTLRGAYAVGTVWIKLGTPVATSPFTRLRVTVTATRVRHGYVTRMTLRYRLNGQSVNDTRCISDQRRTVEWGLLFDGRCG